MWDIFSDHFLITFCVHVAGSVNKAAVRELEKIDAFFSQYADKFDEISIG
jgi:hypothetical protein